MNGERRADGELLAAYADRHDADAFKELHERYSGMVYSMAMRYLNNSQDAEDAAAVCFTVLLRKAQSLRRRGNLGGWFHWCAARTAKNILMARIHRAEREQEAYKMRDMEQQDNRFEAVMPQLEAGIAELPAKMREALVMYFYQGFTQSQIAVEMNRPEGTIATWVKRGVERLRNSLGVNVTDEEFSRNFSRFAVALPVPATLTAKLMLLGEGKAIGSTVAAVADRVASMMFWAQVKTAAAVIGGVVLIGGGTAGVTALALAGQEPEKKTESAVQATPKSKFATPATDPGAEWEDKGLWAGIGYGHGKNGYLDGPRLEAMFYCSPGGPGAIFAEDGAVNAFRTYDSKTDRFMTIIGCGARGSGIDGPFSRVRLGGWGYSSSGGFAGGGSSRYRYYTSTLNGKATLRRLDFVKRVSELAPGNVEVTGCEIFVHEDGYFVRQNTSLRKYSHDGNLVKEYTLEAGPRESLGPYDAKNDRLYGSSREGTGPSKENSWVAWGWDLKAGGKFFGVIPGSHNPVCQPLRKQCATGPFKGSFFYCPGGLGFGPGDPERRYLYMGGGDEANMYRLDLEKQEWIKLVRTADGKRWRFGEAGSSVQAWDAGGGIRWAADGSEDMYPGYRGWNRKYERVK